jgi:hypothetical protein
MCLTEYYAMKTYCVVEVYSYFHTFLIWQHEFVSKTIGVEFVGGQSGTETGFSPDSSVLPFWLYHQCSALISVIN